MVDIEELINKINKRMTPKEAYELYFVSFFCGYPTNIKLIKEAYELNKTVLDILKSDKYTKEYKDKLKSDAMLEPLSMLASCYEEDTQ